MTKTDIIIFSIVAWKLIYIPIAIILTKIIGKNKKILPIKINKPIDKL
jgi:hypothetical protein